MRAAQSTGSEWRACRAIALHALQRRAAMGGNALSWILLAFGLGLPLLIGFPSHRWGLAIGLAGGIPLTLLALLWWSLLLISLVEQNGKGSALLPGMRRRSARVLVLAYLLLAATLALLYAAAGAPYLAALVGSGVVLIGCAMLTVFPKLGWVAFAAVMLPQVFKHRLGNWPAALSVDVMTAIGLLFIVLCTCLIKWRLSPRRAPLPLPAGGRLADGKPMRAERAPAVLTGAWTLRRDCAARDTGALLVQGLGPALRVTALWAHYLVWMAIAAVVCYATWSSVAAQAHGLRVASLVLTLGLQCLVPQIVIGTMYRRRREQALLCLTAAAPAAAGFNRLLGATLLRQFGLWWGATTMMTVAIVWLCGASAGEALRLLPVCCMNLVAGGLILRDYAVSERRHWSVTLFHTVWFLAMVALALAALYLHWPAALWGALGLALPLALLGWAAYRWRGFVRMAPAFPAGRAA